MNFFKGIRELFAAIREFWAVYCGKQTNESYELEPHVYSLEELDQLAIPSDDVLDTWITELNEEDRNSLLAEGRQVTRQNLRKFLTIVRALYSTPFMNIPIQTHCATARRIIAPLATRFARIEEPEWTELEIDNWLETLEDGYKSQVLDNVRRHKSHGSNDQTIWLSLCAARRKVEQLQAQAATLAAAQAENKKQSGGTGLLHLWYVWQEESRKMEQQEFFTRENRKARGW